MGLSRQTLFKITLRDIRWDNKLDYDISASNSGTIFTDEMTVGPQQHNFYDIFEATSISPVNMASELEA